MTCGGRGGATALVRGEASAGKRGMTGACNGLQATPGPHLLCRTAQPHLPGRSWCTPRAAGSAQPAGRCRRRQTAAPAAGGSPAEGWVAAASQTATQRRTEASQTLAYTGRKAHCCAQARDVKRGAGGGGGGRQQSPRRRLGPNPAHQHLRWRSRLKLRRRGRPPRARGLRTMPGVHPTRRGGSPSEVTCCRSGLKLR